MNIRILRIFVSALVKTICLDKHENLQNQCLSLRCTWLRFANIEKTGILFFQFNMISLDAPVLFYCMNCANLFFWRLWNLLFFVIKVVLAQDIFCVLQYNLVLANSTKFMHRTQWAVRLDAKGRRIIHVCVFVKQQLNRSS